MAPRRPLGSYVETDKAEADEATIVENILSGEYSHPLRVIAFNTAEGWARDVTEDIARSVLSLAQSEHRSIGIAAQEFLVRALGVEGAHGRLSNGGGCPLCLFGRDRRQKVWFE